MGTPNSTSAQLPDDVIDFIARGTPLSYERMAETGLDIAFLEYKVELMKPHLKNFAGFKTLSEGWVEHFDDMHEFTRIALSKEFLANWLCARLLSQGFDLYRHGVKTNTIMFIFLVKGGGWIVMESLLSRPGGYTPIRIDTFATVRQLCGHLSAYANEHGYDQTNAAGSTFALRIGLALDTVIDDSIEAKDSGLEAQRRLRDKLNGVNVRYFEAERPSAAAR